MKTQELSKKIIAFAVADYLLGLSLDAVIKIVTCPLQLSQTLKIVGLGQVGDRTITILNLHKKLQLRDALFSNTAYSPSCFLLIAQARDKELCGILLDKPPNLIEIPSQEIRDVPYFYGHAGKLDWFSQIVISQQKQGVTGTILMLNINQALKRMYGHSIRSLPNIR